MAKYNIEYRKGSQMNPETVEAADVSVHEGWLIATDGVGVVLQVPADHVARVKRAD